MGKRPQVLITDGLHSCHDAFNREFYTNTDPRSRHINAIKLKNPTNDANNNKMERINGEIRDREKVMRGLKKKDTPILEGMQICRFTTISSSRMKGLEGLPRQKSVGLLLMVRISGSRLSRTRQM
jgi:hypothetical protein